MSIHLGAVPENIYLFKINNRDARERCEISSKLTQKRHQDVIDVVLASLLLILKIFFIAFQCFYC